MQKAIGWFMFGMSLVVFGVFGLLCLGLFLVLGSYAGNQYDIGECHKLEAQAAMGLRDFYITKLWDDTCRSHEIVIKAPVK